MIVILSTVSTYLMTNLTNSKIFSLIQETHNPELVSAIESLAANNLQTLIVINLVAILTVFFVTILITHRFVGPIVSIIRYLEELRTHKSSNLNKRNDDGMGPLIDYLNTVKISVISKNEKGMTLIEVLVCVFILSIISLTLASSMNTVNSEMKSIQTKSSKSDLATAVRRNAGDYLSLYNSAQMPSNTILRNCLQGASATACTHGAEIEFNYYTIQKDVPIYNAANNITGYQPSPIGGISNLTCSNNPSSPFPVFHTINGQDCNCTAAAITCPLQIITKFTAFCSVGTSCRYPVGLKVSYEIRPRTDLPADFTTPISKLSGTYFVPTTDNDYYTKFSYGGAYSVDGLGIEQINFSIGEFELRQGGVLNFLKPSIIRMNIAFSAPVPISRVELHRYVYPTGCSASTLGTVTGANCNPPLDSSFAFVKNIATPANLTFGNIGTDDAIPTNSVVDYKALTFGVDNSLISTSKFALRAAYSENPTLTVTPPPAGIYFVCDPADTTTNIFKFQATTPTNGWASLTAKVSPPLTFNATVYETLPGFENFNSTSSAVQDIVVDSKYFNSAGGSYSITFQGTTNSGLIRSVTQSFTVNPKPTVSATILAPASGSTVRSISDLNVSAEINLKCAETLSTVNFGINKQADGSVLMPNTDIKASCTKDTGAPVDENNFTCTTIFPCKTWLNVTDPALCLTKFTSDTGLIANLSATTNNSVVIAAPPKSFTVGSKVTVTVHKDYVQFVNFNYPGVLTPPLQTKVKFNLSSALLSGETLALKLSDGQTFNCTNPSAQYSSSACTIMIQTPVGASNLSLISISPNTVVGTPGTIVFKHVGPSILTCSAPACSPGKTLKTRITKLGLNPYDNMTWNINGNYLGYNLVNSTSTLDFFHYYRPTSLTSIPILNVRLTFGVIVTDQYISEKIYAQNIKTCVDLTKCENDYTHIDSSYFNSKKMWYQPGNLSLTSAPGWMSPVKSQFAIIKECYCE